MKTFLTIALVVGMLLVAEPCKAAGPSLPAGFPFEYAYDWLKGYNDGLGHGDPNTGRYDFTLEGMAIEFPTSFGVKRQALSFWMPIWQNKRNAYLMGHAAAP